MSFKERITQNPEIYAIIAVLSIFSPLIIAGLYSYLDARHDAKGSAEAAKAEVTKELETVYETVSGEQRKMEIRSLKRAKRNLENYQRLAPNSEYSAAREAEIAALRDEIEELE